MGGHYRLRHLLGQGAMGAVYEAADERTAALVAVKLLRPELLADAGLVRRFRRESRSVSGLDHPFVVKVFDFAEDDDTVPFLVMERLFGRTLGQLLRQEGPLPLDRIAGIVAQALEAVGYAHRRGVLHRDLKPGNIMLLDDREGQGQGGAADCVKVCDFGLAKLFSVDADANANTDDGPTFSDTMNSSDFGTLCGTPEYMSPEQARSEPLDGRADIYSIGVILYQMVAGTVPFRAPSPMGVLSRHLTQEPEPPSHRCLDRVIPRRLEELILRTLAKDRNSRPSTAEAFADELRALREIGWDRLPPARVGDPDGASTLATLAPIHRVPASPARTVVRKPVIAWVIAGLVGLVAGGLWFGRHPPPVLPLAVGAGSPPSVPSEFPPASALPAVGRTYVRPAQDGPPAQTVVSIRSPSRSKTRRVPSSGAIPPGHSVPPFAVSATLDQQLPPVSNEQTSSSLVDKAEELLAEGHTVEACRSLERAKPPVADAPRLHRFLGKCLMRLGRTDEAKINYRRYLELFPDAPDAEFIREILD